MIPRVGLLSLKLNLLFLCEDKLPFNVLRIAPRNALQSRKKEVHGSVAVSYIVLTANIHIFGETLRIFKPEYISIVFLKLFRKVKKFCDYGERIVCMDRDRELKTTNGTR